MEKHHHSGDQNLIGQTKLDLLDDLTAQMNTGFVDADLCLKSGGSMGKSDTIRALNANLPTTCFPIDITPHEIQAEVESALAGEPRKLADLRRLGSLVYPWGGSPVPILVDAPSGPTVRDKFLAAEID